MKKLTILTGLLTLFLTSFLTMDLKAQWYVYGDMVVYGNSEMRKNLDVDSTITTLYIIVDSIKINDSTIIGSYSGTLASVSFVNDQIGAIVFYDRDSVYQYEQDSSIARQEMLYNRDSVLAYEIDSSLARLTDITTYTFDEGLTETAGNVDLGGNYAGITLNGQGSSNFTINAETTYNDGIYTGFAGGSSVKTAFQNTTSGGDPVYFIINDCDDQSILMRQGIDTDGEVVFSDLGLSYGADISSRNSSNPRWIPDKGYVDYAVAEVDFDFENCLTKLGSTVTWGGTFTESTTVDMDGYYLYMHGGSQVKFETSYNSNSAAMAVYPGDGEAYIRYDKSTGEFSKLYLYGNSIELSLTDASYDSKSLIITESIMVISDDIELEGIAYGGDYSADADERWITDRAYVDSYYSGSLTDGAPTDAELDAAIGSTPSGVGANRKFLVLDTDGTGLYYVVISNGSNWIYFPGLTGTTAS